MGFKSKLVAEASAPKKGFSSIWKLNLEKDIGVNKPCHFAILHDTEDLWQTSEDKKDNGNIHVHYIKGQPKPPLCNLIYFDDDDPSAYCDFCQLDSSYGGKNKPVKVKVFLSFIYELLGKMKPSKDGTTEYKVNPVKLVEISCGKQNINFLELEDAVTKGKLLSIYDDPANIWKVSKLDKGISQPITADLRKLGKQFDTAVPQEILDQYSKENFPSGELKGLIISSYGNVKKDHPMFEEIGVIWPKEEEPKAPEEAEEVSDTKGTADLDD